MFNQYRIEQLHRAMGIRPDPALYLSRFNVVEEESAELLQEIAFATYGPEFVDRPALAKELADVLVVAYGTADVFGIPLDPVFAEVMASNATKFDDNGKPIFREDGKFLKGPNYRPPDVASVLKTYADLELEAHDEEDRAT